MTNRMREPTIGLFFEVDPLPGHSDRYFELAAVLRPELEKNAGLIFIDRYKSIDRPNIVLSHSWWESEEALIAWRQHAQHRAIQTAGRERHFQDYHLRIGRLVATSEEAAPRRLLRATYLDAEHRQRDGELFKSTYRDSKFLMLSDAPRSGGSAAKERLFEVIRDYTMYDRGEAPQHYPPVDRHKQVTTGRSPSPTFDF
jgi:heme-degrading monooxygenase HmoA